MGVYDQASHYVVKSALEAFFAWRMPRFLERYTFLGWQDTTTMVFPGEGDRIGDLLAEFAPLHSDGPRCLLDTEFQAEPRGDMLERAGEYLFRIRREVRHGPGQQGKYRVLILLVNLTGPEQGRELDMREETLDQDGVSLRATQCTLREEDSAATLARIAAGELSRWVLPWIPLMRGGDQAAIMEEWKRLASAEPNARWHGDYGGLALVFAELAGRWSAWKQALEGWNMQVSQQVLEWQAQARIEGEVERLRAVILRALELRFRQAVPADLAEAVKTRSNLEELNRWFEWTLLCNNLDEFRAAVGQRAGTTNGQAPV